MKNVENIFNPYSYKLYLKFKDNLWVYKYINKISVLYFKNEFEDNFICYISKVIFYTIFSFILALFIFFFNMDYKNLYIFLIVFILPVFMFANLNEKANEKTRNLTLQLPNFFYNLALLISAGIDIEKALDIIYSNSSKDKNNQINFILESVFLEKNKGKSVITGFLELSRIFKINALNSFILILKQSIKNGSYDSDVKLIELALLMQKEYRDSIKEISAKLSSKLLMPLMVSLVAIMAMFLVPVILQMDLN